jgi:hypothetical protein
MPVIVDDRFGADLLDIEAGSLGPERPGTNRDASDPIAARAKRRQLQAAPRRCIARGLQDTYAAAFERGKQKGRPRSRQYSSTPDSIVHAISCSTNRCCTNPALIVDKNPRKSMTHQPPRRPIKVAAPGSLQEKLLQFGGR